MTSKPRIAYFSMEIALESHIPTYSGGLGVLAGDMLRSAADLALPVIGVTMVHRHGYFAQQLDERGQQSERPDSWDPGARLERVAQTVSIDIEGRTVHIGAWRYAMVGRGGASVAVLLLDTDLDENDPGARGLVGSLYGGDERYRLAQEAVLGYGGYALLEALGLEDGLTTFHMNEGHAALLVAAAVERRCGDGGAHSGTLEALNGVRPRFVFTTHTPVPAGHDRFEPALAAAVLGESRAHLVASLGALDDGLINMTSLALRGSRYTNAVAMRHGEISRVLFAGEEIGAITNGVHVGRWTSPALAALFDRRIAGWQDDNAYLRHAVGIAPAEITAAHAQSKGELCAMVRAASGIDFDPAQFTVGFARRAAAYKRGALIFSDLDRLRAIAERVGPLQFVFGGKSHPRDEDGKAVIRRIFEAARALEGSVRVVYIENYEMSTAARIVAGADVWLNTPRVPLEASGTSGMKAAVNGVPSLSTLDGWWVEGCIEGVTGWAIGDGHADATDAADACALYEKLEAVVVPLYYREPQGYALVRRNAIALNGSYFNTQRMVEQYTLAAYGRAAARADGAGASS